MSASPALLRQRDSLTVALEREPLLRVEMPLRLESVANGGQGKSWGGRMVRSKATKKKRGDVAMAFKAAWARSFMPFHERSRLVVLMTRVSPGELDSDNLARALKPVRDGVADVLGINDRDPRIEWLPDQEKRRGGYAVRVEVYDGA